MVSSEYWILEIASSDLKEALQSLDKDKLSDLNRIFYKYLKNNPLAKNHLDSFLKKLTFSNSNVDDWSNSLKTLSDYLDSNNLTMKFEDLTEYVSCYFEAGSDEDISVFIELYGIERAN